MMMRLLPLALALPVLACSPAQQCRDTAMRPLVQLDSQIRTAQENIARGHELVLVAAAVPPERVCTPLPPRPAGVRPGWGTPTPPDAAPEAPEPDPPRFRDYPDNGDRSSRGRLSTRGHGTPHDGTPRQRCRVIPGEEAVYSQRPVNVEAERAKLDSLLQQRARLVPQVEAQLAQCPAD